MKRHDNGRFPRTMNEAFGPYARLDIPREMPFTRKRAIFLWTLAAALAWGAPALYVWFR